MGLFSFGNKNKTHFYSEKDMDAYEKMIEDHFGKYNKVIHEIISPDLHIDVIPVPPSKERNYYVLFTMGMGAYRMSVPSSYGKMNRAEMAIRLPADWDIQSNEEKWYWPIGLIKSLARLPYYEKTYLGLYHDVDFGTAFSEETKMCGVLLDIFDKSVEPLVLESGDQVIVYNVIPIFRTEMDFKITYGAEALLEKLGDETIHGPLNMNRKSAVQ